MKYYLSEMRKIKIAVFLFTLLLIPAFQAVPLVLLAENDHFAITIVLKDKDGVIKREFGRSLLDPIHPEVIVIRKDPSVQSATVKISMKLQTGGPDLLNFSKIITDGDFLAAPSNQYILEPNELGPIVTTDLERASYEIKAVVISSLDTDPGPGNDEIFLSNNNDSEIAIIRQASETGEPGGFVAAPEINPIIIILMLFVIIGILQRK